MAARSIWNGNLKLGKVGIGVKLYAAVEDREVHFHLLHDRDEERVKQHMVNPNTGEIREGADIHRAFEIKPGTLVLLTDAELAKLEPAPAREIDVERFIPETALEPVWYERPYYLGPVGKSADYHALSSVLAEKKCVGLARWVMRKRVYHGALRGHGDHLTLSTLHSLEEVAQPPKVAPLPRAADARELGMAQQLVDALAGEFEPTEFKNEHRDRVLEAIAAKAKGKRVELPPRERKRPARELSAALEQSLKQVHKQSEAKERRSA
jgi:DNA end-binding protein Ku